MTIPHAIAKDALTAKVALVTGAARGIGRAIALELAYAGANVALNDLDIGEEAQEVQHHIVALGRTASLHQADVSQRHDVEGMVQAIVARYGRLDIMINNAAMQREEPFLEITDDALHRVLDVDLKSVVLCGQIAARQMISMGRGGRIINISSVHAFSSFKSAALYDAAKAGVVRLTATMALELAQYAITVNAIAPGWMDTPGTAPFLNTEDNRLAVNASLPVGRVGNPHEVGQLAAYLCSEAAAYITGACIVIDGGYMLGR